MNDRVDRERARALMMAALDGEIAPSERRELDELMGGAPELETEWRRLVRVKEVTSSMAPRQPPEEVWDRYWLSVYRRAERGIAWTLIAAGVIVLAAFALWHAAGALFADTDLPVFVKVAIVGIAAGAAILILSVVREKYFTARRDPYRKEVVR